MNNESNSGGNFCTTVGAFAATGAVTTHATTNVINYAIDGIGYTKAAITGGVTPVLDVNGKAVSISANQARSVVWALNAAGTVVVLAGPIVAWDGGITAPNYGFNNAVPELPNLSPLYTAFAITVLKAAATTVGVWNLGTGLWNATGISVVHKNVLNMPSRPLLV